MGRRSRLYGQCRWARLRFPQVFCSISSARLGAPMLTHQRSLARACTCNSMHAGQLLHGIFDVVGGAGERQMTSSSSSSEDDYRLEVLPTHSLEDSFYREHMCES